MNDQETNDEESGSDCQQRLVSTPAYIFDGFCERPYREDFDGWMMEQKEESRVVRLAREIIDQHEEINELRRENWKLRQRLEKESILNNWG